jgi:subtilisin
LWAVKVCDHLGACTISDIIEGIEYVKDHADEIDVVNISIENTYSSTLNDAIADSVVTAGVTYVVAAGNSGIDASNTTSPANSPDVITVSAIGDTDGKCGGLGSAVPTIYEGKFINDDTFAYFSNFGSVVDIAAPGVDIFSTYNGTDYGLDSGTSMAAPHVTGAVASYKAAHPQASTDEIRNWLTTSGSIPITVCDGKAYGYFSGDPDGFAEPMLHI